MPTGVALTTPSARASAACGAGRRTRRARKARDKPLRQLLGPALLAVDDGELAGAELAAARGRPQRRRRRRRTARPSPSAQPDMRSRKLSAKPQLSVLWPVRAPPANTTVLTAPIARRPATSSVRCGDDRLLERMGDVEAGEAQPLRPLRGPRPAPRRGRPSGRNRSAHRGSSRPSRAPSRSCMSGERDDWMPRPTRPIAHAAVPPRAAHWRRCPSNRSQHARQGASPELARFLPASRRLRRRRPSGRSCLCRRAAGKWLRCVRATMYELVSLVNRRRRRARVLQSYGRQAGVRADEGQRGDAHAGPGGHAPEHHRDRLGGVRAQRAVRRPDRRDRGAHALQQAHDLLLFRRQGGALPQRARERLPARARGRGEARHRGPAAARGADAGWSSSPSTITTSTRTSSAW